MTYKTCRAQWNAKITVMLLVFLASCASLPKDYPREPTRAWDRPQETKLGRAISADMGLHPGMPGFHLLASGMDAFVGRMALADTAEQTLDLQYYIFHFMGENGIY
jgi:putative cardiolipin synthase